MKPQVWIRHGVLITEYVFDDRGGHAESYGRDDRRSYALKNEDFAKFSLHYAF